MQKTFHDMFLIVEKKSSFRFLMMVTMLLFTLLLAACGNSGSATGAGSGTPTASATGTSTPAKTSTTAPASAGSSSTTAPVNTVPAKQLQFTNIRMVSTSIGWSLTHSGVYKTVDGGRNWYNAGPSNTQIKNPSGEFLNVNDAWIVLITPNNGNANAFQVIRTVDGGRNWQTSSTVAAPGVQDYPGGPMFINSQDGWIEVVTNGGPGAGSESVAIFRTTDGGMSWTKVADTTKPGSDLPNGGFKSGISFKDTQNGWATGRDASSAPWLYVTHDGGVSWKKQALPGAWTNDANASLLTTPPVFFGNKGVLPVSVSLPNGAGTAIYTTSDGGETWTAPQGLTAFTIDSTNDIYVTDQTHAWAINSKDKQLYMTSSINWQTWKSPAVTSPYKFVQLSFVDATNGWAIGGAQGNALLHTLDGGDNWTYL